MEIESKRVYLFGCEIRYHCINLRCSGACHSIAWDNLRPIRTIRLCTFCGPVSVYDPRDYKRWK